MNRRELITASLALGAVAPWRARAQSKAKAIGLLSPFSAISVEQLLMPFHAALTQLGWVEGQNLAVERRYADGDETRLPGLALELVRRGVDVIWALAPEAAVAAAQATKTVPVVFWGINYPVELGLADSFSRPGRNVTGVAFFAGVGVGTKIFEFLREMAPATQRVAGLASLTALRTVSGEQFTGSRQVIDSAARSLGLQYRTHDTRTPEEFQSAFASILKWRADALIAWATPATVREMARIIDFARTHRLPSAVQLKEQARQGALLSYGPDIPATLARSAAYVDRVLRGARPADLPIDLPSKYELVINMKTAKALGLAVRPSFLALADEVIQ